MSYRCLTSRQRAVYEFVLSSLMRTGCTPTLSEIASGTGAQAVSGVHRVVKELDRKGFIRSRGRQIEILPTPELVRLDDAARAVLALTLEADWAVSELRDAGFGPLADAIERRAAG